MRVLEVGSLSAAMSLVARGRGVFRAGYVMSHDMT
jgi:hypothetical protein